jgi:hypothetical protein
MLAFFNLGVQELIILAMLAFLALGSVAVIILVVTLANRRKPPDQGDED